MLPFLFFTSAFAGTSATSSKKDAGSSLAVDGQLQTSWIEDAPGHGTDERFTLTLHKTLEIKTISIWPGNLSNGSRSFTQYARPKLIRIMVNGEQVGEPTRLTDNMRRFDIDVETTGTN